MLGDPDPRRRDELALPVLVTWIQRGVYDDLLPGLGDGMAAGLRVGLGERGTDTVFRRSFSVLVLSVCIERDTERPLVPGGKVLDWADRVATWLLAEQDVRGYVPGKGWAHAVAHGADAVGALAASPHFGAPELTVLLDVLGERVVGHVEHLFVNHEADRLALATVALLRRERVPFDVLEAWLDRLVSTAIQRSRSTRLHRDPDLDTGNLDLYLRALYLQLAIGPRPPATRADLLLLLVDSLRALNTPFLGAPDRRTAVHRRSVPGA
ncbi:MAG: hypothetical protein CMH83_22520 [Nocardioides sp.]|nr:hypothetical protein [Nocardioides sp.]